MRNTTAAAVAATAALLLSLTGCQGSTEPTVTPPAVTDTAPATEEATTSPSPTVPAVADTTDLKLGTVVTAPATDIDPAITVVALARKKFSDYGSPVTAIQVRVCIGKGPNADPDGYPVTSEPWALLLDGGEAEFSNVTTGGQEPNYPLWEPRIVKPGKCVKGWINFSEVPSRPGAVQYTIEGFQATWKL